MENKEFRQLVQSMRDAQNAYFERRIHKGLIKAKGLERMVDRELREESNPQQSLKGMT